MAHRLEFFGGGCALCDRFLTDVELGKCGACQLDVLDVRQPSARGAVHRYGIRVVPTLIIDGRIKVEGPLDEPWMCGDDFYQMLEARFGFRPSPA